MGLVVIVACSSCGTNSTPASASSTLRSAANATAQARSFTLSVAGADVIYQAPDRVQQVEHGQATSASGTNGGPVSSSAPFPQTITKVFVGDRYYEADTADGAIPTFTSTRRCANDQSAPDAVLRLLRAIAASADVQTSGDSYSFRIPDQGENTPTSGTATVSGGFVRTLTFTPSTETVTISDINTAPPVTAPADSTPADQSCSS
jgi:hypothetical protein